MARTPVSSITLLVSWCYLVFHRKVAVMLEHSDKTESLTARLAREQETHAPFFETRVRYRLYTEGVGDIVGLVSRYFAGATIIPALGVWGGEVESSAVIEILGTDADLQRVVDLAGDIRVTNKQYAVYVTRDTLVDFREVSASV